MVGEGYRGEGWILTRVEGQAGFGLRLHYLADDGRRQSFHVYPRHDSDELRVELGDAFAQRKRVGREGRAIGGY